MGEIMIVGAKGQITLPTRIRSQLGIKAGDRVVGENSKDGFVLKKPLDFFSLKSSLSGGRIPDNEEDLLSEEFGRQMTERT